MMCQQSMRVSVLGANVLVVAIGLLFMAPADAFLSLAPLSLRPLTCASTSPLPALIAARPAPTASIFMLAKAKVGAPCCDACNASSFRD